MWELPVKCDWDHILHAVFYSAFFVQYVLTLFLPWQHKPLSQYCVSNSSLLYGGS